MNHVSLLDSLLNELDIQIKLCLDVTKNSDWFEKKSMANYDWWIVVDGQIHISVGNEEYILNPGDVFLFYPNVLHEAYSISQSCRFIFSPFDINIGSKYRILGLFSFDGLTPADKVRDEVRLFVDCYWDYKKKAPLTGLRLKGCFMLLLSKIIDYKHSYSGNTKISGSEFNRPPMERLLHVLLYISQNLDKPIYIKELARIIGLSETYFITYFKETVGATPSSYILQLKMKRALEYLHERKFTVKEVANLVGYCDQHVFSKAFKRVYGMAPSSISKK